MKKKYNVQIADIHLSILSDEPEELVADIVSQLNDRICTMTQQNRRCSKLDAALLYAMELLGEQQNYEKKIKNLEAQILLYESTANRAHSVPETSESDEKPSVPDEAIHETPPTESESSETEKEDVGHTLRDEKLRQIEELLRRRNESAAAPDEKNSPSARDAKLRQIEELLRGAGSGQSLSEVLQNANND